MSHMYIWYEAELPGTREWTGRNGKCRDMEDCVQHMV